MYLPGRIELSVYLEFGAFSFSSLPATLLKPALFVKDVVFRSPVWVELSLRLIDVVAYVIPHSVGLIVNGFSVNLFVPS